MFTVNFLYRETSIRLTPPEDGHMVMVPAVFQSFYCNQTPYKTDTSLRWTMDTLQSLTDTWEVFFISENTSKLRIDLKQSYLYI